jgi:hypothetical protein
VPTTPEAAATETTTDAVRETATAEMGGAKAAIHTYGATHAMAEATTPDMGDTHDAVVETHAVMDDCPLGADAVTEAMIEAAVVRVATKNSRVAVTVPIAEIIRTCRSTAISRIVDGIGWAVVLSSSRLRSSECSHRQPNATSQQHHFGR